MDVIYLQICNFSSDRDVAVSNHQLINESFCCLLFIVCLAGSGVTSCFYASDLVIGVGR